VLARRGAWWGRAPGQDRPRSAADGRRESALVGV